MKRKGTTSCQTTCLRYKTKNMHHFLVLCTTQKTQNYARQNTLDSLLQIRRGKGGTYIEPPQKASLAGPSAARRHPTPRSGCTPPRVRTVLFFPAAQGATAPIDSLVVVRAQERLLLDGYFLLPNEKKQMFGTIPQHAFTRHTHNR